MSDTEPLILYYDFVDPASFLLLRRLQESGVGPISETQLRPFELNPPPQPLLDPERKDWREYWHFMTEAARETDLVLARPRIVPWTRKAHELTLHAASLGQGVEVAEIRESLFRAYLLEGRDIGRVDVLVALALEQGLDPAETRTVLSVDKYTADLETIRVRDVENGVSRTPTLVRGRRSFQGYPSASELASFLADGPKQN